MRSDEKKLATVVVGQFSQEKRRLKIKKLRYKNSTLQEDGRNMKEKKEVE